MAIKARQDIDLKQFPMKFIWQILSGVGNNTPVSKQISNAILRKKIAN
jgi:hypothetical protein